MNLELLLMERNRILVLYERHYKDDLLRPYYGGQLDLLENMIDFVKRKENML